jgi:hypothetical protein
VGQRWKDEDDAEDAVYGVHWMAPWFSET